MKLKLTIATVCTVLSLTAALAQTDSSIAKSGIPIEMLFPQG